MGLFSKALGVVGLGGTPDFGKLSEDAFRREQARLRKTRVQARQDANFISTEGKGIADQANFTFGDQTDLENLTPEERLQRKTGRIDTGLIL